MVEQEDENVVIDAPKDAEEAPSEQDEMEETTVITADEGMAKTSTKEEQGAETNGQTPASPQKLLEKLDTLKNKLQPQGQQGASTAPADPLSEFAVVELKMTGTSKAAKKIDDRVAHTVMLLSKDQRSEFGKLKVEFYRYLGQVSSFRLDKKYVVPIRLLDSVEKVYRDLEAEFLNARKDTFNYLSNNWDHITKEIKKRFPDLLIPEPELANLKPEDLGFIEMDYSIRTLTKMIEEMKELKELFLKGGLNNKYIAERIDRQKKILIEEIRAQYDEKMQRLTDSLEKLSKLKPNAKSYEKTAMKTETLMETVNEIAHVIGEETSLASKLEEMKLKLASPPK